MLELVDPEGIFYRTWWVPLWKITRISCAQIQWFKSNQRVNVHFSNLCFH